MKIQYNDIWYELNADGTASVSEHQKLIQADVNIPSAFTYQERRYRVTSIRPYAFFRCIGLTAITIPDSVTSIGENAFYDCKGLTAITIPNSLTSIGMFAFDGCTGLTAITIPNSLTSIGECAFRGCTGLTAITIPDSVTSIGKSAFAGCTGLTAITIPNSLTSIGMFAFDCCTGLTKIQVALDNPTYDSREECNAIIETATNTLITGCCTTIIPNSVTKIKDSAFGCTELTAITIPDSVTSIGEEAFINCTGLTSITIPNSVTSIGEGAFCGCTGLTSITIPNSVTSIGEWAFCGCTGLTTISIPNSVTSIEHCAFEGCTGLTNITIPDSVTSIGERAFEGCTGLTTLIIPNSVTSIEHNAFCGCTGLTAIIIPNSLTSIGQYAFKGCTGLTAITIPNSLTSIRENIFHGCTGLTKIQVAPNNPIYDSREECNAIIETAKNRLIAGCRTTIIPDSVTRVGEWAFCGCTGLTTITITDSVRSIGWHAFEGCTGLTSITIPDSVTSIESHAFSGCTGLTAITIPNSVTSIEWFAFYHCEGLTSITLPKTLTSIREHVFDGCENLQIIRVPKGKKEDYGQLGLKRWLSITHEVSTADINDIHFSIDYTAGKVSVIPFDDDTQTYRGDVIVPANLLWDNQKFTITHIEESTFAHCDLLTSITLPKTLTSIGEHVFDGCENLQIIRVPKGKKEDYCKLGLEPYRELIQEPQEEEYTILLNIARGYEKGIGMAKNLAQAVLCYVQAADKGCNEAAFHLGELYETGNGLPQDLRQAAEWYAKATALYHPSAENKRRACLQKLEQEEQRMEAYQHEQAQERAHRVAESAKAKYLFFDTETNGLPYNYKAGIENTSNWPRLLQIGWIMTDERGNVLKSCTKWIFPNGFSVDSEVTKLTGITTDKLLFEGERISSVLNDFLQDIENAEILVGHNVEYDIMVVGCELYRDGQPMQGQALTRHPHICTMKQTVDFCAIPSTNSYYSDYKYPKLTELYTKLFGHAFSGAHDAMADIKATKECFFELKRRGIL